MGTGTGTAPMSSRVPGVPRDAGAPRPMSPPAGDTARMTRGEGGSVGGHGGPPHRHCGPRGPRWLDPPRMLFGVRASWLGRDSKPRPQKDPRGTGAVALRWPRGDKGAGDKEGRWRGPAEPPGTGPVVGHGPRAPRSPPAPGCLLCWGGGQGTLPPLCATPRVPRVTCHVSPVTCAPLRHWHP